MKRVLLLSFLFFFLAGCSTKYLVGYHYLGDEGIVTGVVSAKTEKVSKPFEEKCIQALIHADMVSFKKLFTDRLLKAVTEKGYTELEEAIRTRYQPSGRYDRMKVLDMRTEHLHLELDTAALLNGFKHYDYIEAQHLLYGASNLVVHLYLTEIGENPRLSGFALHDADSTNQEKGFSIRYLVPETVDKAGLIGTEIIKFPE